MRETCAPLNEKIDELRQELQLERRSHRAELKNVETETDAVRNALAHATSNLAQIHGENDKQLESYDRYWVDKSHCMRSISIWLIIPEPRLNKT